ncbi:MAG: sugar ABC transporter permease [Candidatus Hydrogenedentes bacterium]|nr:sugar ABC transporter permease [Candidatus Hydrogenedentota bacterium]
MGRQTRKVLRESIASLVLCGPAVLLYAGFMVFPAILGFAYSLTDWTGWSRTPHFTGLANFREAFADARFFDAIGFTLFETVLIVLFFSFGTMLLAIVLDGLRVWKGAIRGLFFYPYKYMANYNEGVVNTLLRWAGLDALAQDWMGDPRWVAYFIFALVAWNGAGFFTTVYLANLQTIPTDLYEAARIDGAGAFTVFTRIQFPMLVPTLTTNSVLALITGINLFPQIVVTTYGGPGWRTFSIGFYIYQLGVVSNRQGYASAISFITFAALVAISAVQVALLRRRQVAL